MIEQNEMDKYSTGLSELLTKVTQETEMIIRKQSQDESEYKGKMEKLIFSIVQEREQIKKDGE